MKSGTVVYRRLLGSVLLTLFCLLLHGHTLTANADQEIAITPAGIRIQVTERALGEVLGQIQEMSGVRFSIPQKLGTTPVTATIEALDWPAAIRELLEPFSTAKVWNKQQLSRVFLLERGQAANLSDEPLRFSESERQKLDDLDTPEPPPAASLPTLPPPPPPMDAVKPTSEGKLR